MNMAGTSSISNLQTAVFTPSCVRNGMCGTELQQPANVQSAKLGHRGRKPWTMWPRTSQHAAREVNEARGNDPGDTRGMTGGL